MNTVGPLRLADWLCLILVFLAAGAARGWYLYQWVDQGRAEAILHVQDPLASDVDGVVDSLKEKGLANGFEGHAPLGPPDEKGVTAHLAPGFPTYLFLVDTYLSRFADPVVALRWTQCVLGALTAAFYFLIARRAFGNALVGTIAGLLCAFHPFWIINVAERNDGVLISFLLSAVLLAGVRSGQQGGALTSMLFGLLLAALSLVRASCLPFAIVAVLWFFLRSRRIGRGWLYAILTLLGFALGLAPWSYRNYETYQQPVPIVTTAWWHLWVGNNPEATGGPWKERMDGTIPGETRAELEMLTGSDQPRRYAKFGPLVATEVLDNPIATMERRLFAGLTFLTSGAALQREAIITKDEGVEEVPMWLQVSSYGTLLGMLVLGLLGWRWSYSWGRVSAPLGIALIMMSVPYMLSYSAHLHGPRLPLDGILLSLSAFALVWFIPVLGGWLRQGEPSPEGY